MVLSIVISFSLSAFFYIPASLATVEIPTTTSLGFPDYGSYLTFEENCSLDSSSYREGGSEWHLINLNLHGSISNVTISTTVDMTLRQANHGWINYTVTGYGMQTFSIAAQPTEVYIDGQKTRDGWLYSPDSSTITITSAGYTADLKFDVYAPLGITGIHRSDNGSLTSPLPLSQETLPVIYIVEIAIGVTISVAVVVLSVLFVNNKKEKKKAKKQTESYTS